LDDDLRLEKPGLMSNYIANSIWFDQDERMLNFELNTYSVEKNIPETNGKWRQMKKKSGLLKTLLWLCWIDRSMNRISRFPIKSVHLGFSNHQISISRNKVSGSKILESKTKTWWLFVGWLASFILTPLFYNKISSYFCKIRLINFESFQTVISKTK